MSDLTEETLEAVLSDPERQAYRALSAEHRRRFDTWQHAALLILSDLEYDIFDPTVLPRLEHPAVPQICRFYRRHPLPPLPFYTLESPDPDARCIALYILGRRGDTARLVTALDDADARVRRSAIAALRRCSIDAVIADKLCHRLEIEPSGRIKRVLIRMLGDVDQCKEILQKMATDADLHVRYIAAAALGKVDISSLAEAWIALERAKKGSEAEKVYEWAFTEEWRIIQKAPEYGWQLIATIFANDPADTVTGMLAAGPLEDLLAAHGHDFIDRIEEKARYDRRFAVMLGGVCRNAMDDAVWQRVVALRGR